MSATKFNLRGKLTLTIGSCRQLANRELIGQMDPYAVITLSGSKDQKFKTKVVKGGHMNPVFDQSYIFNLEGREDLLHCNLWNQCLTGDDNIGRLDLSLDALDMSGKPRWYQLKDKSDFSKQTGEVALSIKFEGNGLPEGSLAHKTNAARLAPESAPAPAVSPAPIQGTMYQSQQPPIVFPNGPAPVATIAPPVVQPQQPYQSQQPNYHQAPQQQYQSQAPQPQYQSQAPPQQYQQPPQPQYQSHQPMYQQPQQPMYQQPQAPYGQPQQFQSQQPMYAPPPQPVYQAPQPVYQQPQPIIQAMPTVVSYGVAAPPAQVIYTQQPVGQLIGYWPNGQPRYAGQ